MCSKQFISLLLLKFHEILNFQKIIKNSSTYAFQSVPMLHSETPICTYACVLHVVLYLKVGQTTYCFPWNFRLIIWLLTFLSTSCFPLAIYVPHNEF